MKKYIYSFAKFQSVKQLTAALIIGAAVACWGFGGGGEPGKKLS